MPFSKAHPPKDSFRKYVWVFTMGELHGGLKARRDCEAILRGTGTWETFDTGLIGSKPAQAAKVLASLWWLLRQPRSSVFLVQYPIHGGRAQRLLASLMFRRFRTLVILHDFDELREKVSLAHHVPFAKASYLVSSGALSEQLRTELKNTRQSQVEAWDYLLPPGFAPGAWDPQGPILFAGSLWPEKVGWLYRADIKRPPLQIRGLYYDEARNPGLGDTYSGPFKSENPVFDPSASWGLVWDGHKVDSQDTQADYERINQPHKLSLYLACGLPLIVWSEGYTAKWVVRNQCGVITPSLAAIPEILAKVLPEEHEAMRRRAQELGARARNGEFLLQSLAELGLNP